MKVDGTPYLCKADEVGEICVNSGTTGMAYFGLLGITKNVFEVCLFPVQCCTPSISSCKQTFVSDTLKFYFLLLTVFHSSCQNVSAVSIFCSPIFCQCWLFISS